MDDQRLAGMGSGRTATAPAPRLRPLPRTIGTAVFLVLALSGCGLLPKDVAPAPAVEAPSDCGFPDGTQLAFAGRSTTALLGVNEIQGDPMSFEPADIYVTRDSFDQGDLHGRLVCAIFVNQPWFVEITVHPADDPFVPPTPAPLGSQPADGVDRQQAVEAALAHVGEPDEWTLGSVEAGSVARLVYDWESRDWTIGLDAEHWVWRIGLNRGDEGVEVFVDYVDGTVLGELRYISQADGVGHRGVGPTASIMGVPHSATDRPRRTPSASAALSMHAPEEHR